MWYNVHKGVGFSPRPLPYFYLAGLKDVGKNFTTLLAITRLLDFGFITLPYPTRNWKTTTLQDLIVTHIMSAGGMANA